MRVGGGGGGGGGGGEWGYYGGQGKGRHWKGRESN